MSVTGTTPDQPRQYSVTGYNRRMANRVARRAHLDEPALAVAFTFNNLLTLALLGLVEDVVKLVPTFGGLIELALSLLSFWFHRIVIVTERRVYVYRDWPLHIPGKRLAVYERGPGTVQIGSDHRHWLPRWICRGRLRFSDGFVVFHGPVWVRRARYIAQEANIPAGGVS